MEQNEKSANQPKPRSRVGIVLLIILLLIAGTIGYLYYSIVKAPFVPDDPAQMAASVTMTPEARFSFSAADKTAQVKMDAADLWSLILAHTGTDFLDTINRELTGYGLSISGCAIHMDEDGLRLDLELFYKETRLLAKVPCDLEVTDQHISLIPTDVKLGMIPLPVGSLLSNLKLEYEIHLPVISNVTQVSFASDAVLLTGPMEEDIRTLVPLDENLYQIAVFAESFQSVADTLQTGEGYMALLSYLEQNPGDVEDLYHALFVMADTDVAEEYLDSRFGLTERFFPGIDFSAIEAEHTALNEQVVPMARLLEQFFNKVSNTYNDKKFTLSGGEFLQKKKPFQAAEFGGKEYEEMFRLLDPDSVFLILVGAEDRFLRNTSSFYRMAEEGLEFTQSVDYNKTYILGCVVRSVDGEPFLLYDTEVKGNGTYARKIKLLPLTEEDVSALQVPGKFGVWTD